jgi:hypothetical protein
MQFEEIPMKVRTFATTAIALTATAVLAAAAPFVTAQSIRPAVVHSSPAPSPAFSDTELRVFAVAVVGVQRVTDTYMPKLKKATTIQDQQRVEETASVEMARVVENQGMTVSRFSQILELTKVSPELADRVRWHIHQSTAVAYRGD